MQILTGIADSINHAMINPFGLDFEIHNKNIYVPFGSVINCLGYNDYLERVVGATRICFALIALIASHDKKERFIAVGHIFRGILEMKGDFEQYLLILDTAWTIYNIAYRIFYRSNPMHVDQEEVV